ncbi:MAG: phosphatase PAP2 family protein [Nitrospinota bacterium]|nr:phosphatase PAP2 family protein [Nitrospinota bacterium]MDH5677811.1 phosphatase PAP2 family protein [Nitrospinota bacterium]MDH5756604.1 phosphatase PAP2 family protein [Nitrospinota bacterium]
MEKFNEELFLWLNSRLASPLMDGVMSFVTVTGDAVVVISFGLVAVAMWPKAPWRRNRFKAAGLFLAALAVGGAAMHGIKQNLPKDRPLAHFAEMINKGEARVRAPFSQLYHRTFPSGHTQTAFGAAIFFALLIRTPAAVVALLAWASMVGLSRVYLGVHFPMDIAGGSVLGAGAAWMVYRTGGGLALIVDAGGDGERDPDQPADRPSAH